MEAIRSSEGLWIMEATMSILIGFIKAISCLFGQIQTARFWSFVLLGVIRVFGITFEL